MNNNINNDNIGTIVSDYNGNPYLKKHRFSKDANTFFLAPYLPVLRVYKFFSDSQYDFLCILDNSCKLNLTIKEFLSSQLEGSRNEISNCFGTERFFGFLNSEFNNYGNRYKGNLLKYINDSFDIMNKKHGDKALYSLTRLTFVGQDDNDVYNCGFGKHEENLISQVYKLAERPIPDNFVDKIYNWIAPSNGYERAYAQIDNRGRNYQELLSLIGRKNKKKFKTKIIKLFKKACCLPFDEKKLSFIDELNLDINSFFVETTVQKKNNLEYENISYLSFTKNNDGSQEFSSGAEVIANGILNNAKKLNAALEKKSEYGQILKKFSCNREDKQSTVSAIRNYISEFQNKMKTTFCFRNEAEKKEAINQLLNSLKQFLVKKFHEDFYESNVPVEICEKNEEHKAIYFYQSVFYAVMLKCLEKKKEDVNKILENMEKVRSDFESIKPLKCSWLNVDKNQKSPLNAFITKIIAQDSDKQIDEKTLDDIRKSALVLYKLISEAVVSTELPIVKKSNNIKKGILPHDILIHQDKLLLFMPSLMFYKELSFSSFDNFVATSFVSFLLELCLKAGVLKKADIESRISLNGIKNNVCEYFKISKLSDKDRTELENILEKNVIQKNPITVNKKEISGINGWIDFLIESIYSGTFSINLFLFEVQVRINPEITFHLVRFMMRVLLGYFDRFMFCKERFNLIKPIMERLICYDSELIGLCSKCVCSLRILLMLIDNENVKKYFESLDPEKDLDRGIISLAIRDNFNLLNESFKKFVNENDVFLGIFNANSYHQPLFRLLLLTDAKEYLKSNQQLEKLKTELRDLISKQEEYKKYDGFKDFFDNRFKLDSKSLFSSKFQVKEFQNLDEFICFYIDNFYDWRMLIFLLQISRVCSSQKEDDSNFALCLFLNEVSNAFLLLLGKFINSEYYDNNFWDQAKSQANIYVADLIAKHGLEKAVMNMHPYQLIRLIDRDDLRYMFSQLDAEKENHKNIIKDVVKFWCRLDSSKKKEHIADILIKCNSVFKEMLKKTNTKTNLFVVSKSVKDENQDSKLEVSFLKKKRKKSCDKDENECNDQEHTNSKKPKLSDDVSEKCSNINKFSIK